MLVICPLSSSCVSTLLYHTIVWSTKSWSLQIPRHPLASSWLLSMWSSGEILETRKKGNTANPSLPHGGTSFMVPAPEVVIHTSMVPVTTAAAPFLISPRPPFCFYRLWDSCCFCTYSFHLLLFDFLALQYPCNKSHVLSSLSWNRLCSFSFPPTSPSLVFDWYALRNKLRFLN